MIDKNNAEINVGDEVIIDHDYLINGNGCITKHLTKNKRYKIDHFYGGNVIINDDTGNPVNGWGLNRDRFIKV